MTELKEGLLRVMADQGVMGTLETDLIVTDLFPADIAKGKHVMLIYKTESVLEEYRALKADKAALVDAGRVRRSGARRYRLAIRSICSAIRTTISRQKFAQKQQQRIRLSKRGDQLMYDKIIRPVPPYFPGRQCGCGCRVRSRRGSRTRPIVGCLP